MIPGAAVTVLATTMKPGQQNEITAFTQLLTGFGASTT